MASDPVRDRSAPREGPLSRSVLLMLLAISLVGFLVVAFLAFRPDEGNQEVILSVREVEAPIESAVNVSAVIDTLTDGQAEAVEGGRYKVRIVDDAKEGASGIARIGGLVTFVPGVRKGDVAIIEVTRLKRSTADAVLLERLPDESRREQPVAARRPTPAADSLAGQTFKGTVTDMGKEGDGVVRVDGKIIFVAGAKKGEQIEFLVTEDLGRFAHGEVVGHWTSPDPVESVAPPAVTTAPKEARDQPVQMGEELEVSVTEKDRRDPDHNGVARVDGFVVFVPGTQPGDQVRIRITEMRARSASSEVLERLSPEHAQP